MTPQIVGTFALIAPELMDVEVVSALRKAVLLGRLDEPRALTAVTDLSRWPVDRISHRALAHVAWRYRHSVSAYDAFYVATARSHEVPLLTGDGKLAGASGLDITVHHIFGSSGHVMERGLD
ncbi:type II toxin-antitoxin system VapC family toxin [Candidatus Palauibacter sp.]|uniref:type II toxin-antitoxin system VapC family toxin n=1 Tax=Candidatus Palauibacter sp. TaxID=3101350 RepID=UPI003AF259F9